MCLLKQFPLLLTPLIYLFFHQCLICTVDCTDVALTGEQCTHPPLPHPCPGLPSPSPTNCLSSPIRDTMDTAAQTRSEAPSSLSHLSPALNCPSRTPRDTTATWCCIVCRYRSTGFYWLLLHLSLFFFFFRQNNSLHRFVGWILREGIIFFALWRNRSVIWKMVRWRHLLTQARTAARISGSLKVGGTGCGPNPPGGPYWKSGRKKEYLEYVWWPASGHVR